MKREREDACVYVCTREKIEENVPKKMYDTHMYICKRKENAGHQITST